MKKGIVVGKFYPPHKGHQFLINTGLNNCDKLHIIVCSLDSETINGQLRKQWLKEMYPCCKIHLINNYDKTKDNDSEHWANLTLNLLKFKPDIVFTSEDYGEKYCKYLNCEHFMVDKKRINVPISGTMVRNNPYKYWDYIDDILKEYYTKRIIFIGPESTGKTTMCQKLAKEFETNWIPEYGRIYCESKNDKWEDKDFNHIAVIQNMLENEYSRLSNKYLFCDTNSFATYVWNWLYLGHCNKYVLKLYLEHKQKYNKHIIFLMKPNVKFVQDGTREFEYRRMEMFDQFKIFLDEINEKYIIIDSDNYNSRYEQVKKYLIG